MKSGIYQSFKGIGTTARKLSKHAEKLSDVIGHFKNGEHLKSALSFSLLLGSVYETLYSKPSVSQMIKRMGLTKTCESNIRGFYADLFLENFEHEVILTEYCHIIYWKDIDMAAVYDNDGDFRSGPYMSPDCKNFEDIISKLIWNGGNEIVIHPNQNASYWSYGNSKQFTLSPSSNVGPYVGTPTPQWYADRLKRYGESPRTVLLVGPSGVGKSVLARHIAKSTAGGSAKILRITSDVVHTCYPKDLKAIINAFNPTVLLIDDIDLSATKNQEKLLALFEGVREPNCLIIATMMAATEDLKERRCYYEGMRPGRIDEIFWMDLPDEAGRKMIIEFYIDEKKMKVSKANVKKFAKETEGLAGAFISEFIKRVNVHGIKNWKEELERVFNAAPKIESEDEEEKTVDPVDSA